MYTITWILIPKKEKEPWNLVLRERERERERERADLGDFCRGNPQKHNRNDQNHPSFISPTHFSTYSKVVSKRK